MKKLLTLISLIILSGICTAQNGHGINLIWTQSQSTGITGNNVYRSTVHNGPYTQIYQSCPSPCTTPNPIVSYEDQTGVVGTTYYYVITAMVGTSESGYSNESSNAYPPQPPTNVQAQKQ